jgi:hypothetical protein
VLGVEALAAVAEAEVLGDGEAEEQPAAFGDVRDAAARAQLRRELGRVAAGVDDPTLERVHEAGDRAQGRRLAGAVRSEERDDLAGADGQVEAADHRRAVVAGGQAFEAQHRVAHAPSSAMSRRSAARSAPAAPR